MSSTFLRKSRERHVSSCFFWKKQRLTRGICFFWGNERLPCVLCRRHSSNGATSEETSFTFSWQDNIWHLASHEWSLEWHMAQGEDGGYWHMAWNEEDMWRLLKVAPHWHLADKWEEREMTSGANLGDKAPIFLGFSKFRFFKRKAYVTPPQCGSHIASLLK